MPLEVVRGRAWAGVPALAGVLFAVPTIFWPTWTLSLTGPPVTEGGLNLTQEYWSWGRVEFLDLRGITADQLGQVSVGPLPPMLHSAVSLFALCGALAWLFRRGAEGRLLGAAGVALLWAQLAHGLMGRLVVESNGTIGAPPDYFTAAQLPAGACERYAFVLASIALLTMLARPAVRAATAAWRFLSAWSARMRESAEGDEPRRATVAVVRDVVADEVDEPGRAKDGTIAGHFERGPTVGFTDLAKDDERFQPPPTT